VKRKISKDYRTTKHQYTTNQLYHHTEPEVVDYLKIIFAIRILFAQTERLLVRLAM